MQLNTFSALSNVKRKRVGRGIASGIGKTCGRGVKGQKSRSGVSIKTEGGQTPLIKRLPKRGFNCSKSIDYKVISLRKIDSLIIEKRIDKNKEINKELLVSIGYIKSPELQVKLLGGFKMTHKIKVNLDAYSADAKNAIESAGGEIISK